MNQTRPSQSCPAKDWTFDKPCHRPLGHDGWHEAVTDNLSTVRWRGELRNG